MKTLIAFITVLVSAFALLIWAAITDSQEWEEFSAAHHCKVTAQIRGDVFNTITPGPNGQVTIGIAATPDKTGYTCDDGVTYFR